MTCYTSGIQSGSVEGSLTSSDHIFLHTGLLAFPFGVVNALSEFLDVEAFLDVTFKQRTARVMS